MLPARQIRIGKVGVLGELRLIYSLLDASFTGIVSRD